MATAAVDSAKSILRNLRVRLLTGTLSRAEYIVHLLALGGVAWLLLLPFLTYFHSLNAFAADVYIVTASIGGVVIVATLVAVYFKTVIGRGLHWAWGLLGFAVPIAVGVIADTYLSQRARGDVFFPSGEVMWVATLVGLTAFLGFPLVARGSRPATSAPSSSPLNRLTTGIVAGSLFVSAAFALYSAYLGSKIYVGWSPHSFLEYRAPRAGSGVFIQCGGLKGVGGYTGGAMKPGFGRDGFEETRFNFLATSADGLDIISHGGPLGEISYREDGFEVSSSRLQLQGPPGYQRIPQDVRQFVILATAISADTSRAQTIVAFSFQRADHGWKVAVSRSGTRPQTPIDKESWAFAGSYLGECRE